MFDFDANEFSANYDRHAFQFKHDLAGNDMFTVSKLLGLADRLPESQVGWHSAKIPMNTSFYQAGVSYPAGIALDEALSHIETSGSYVIIRYPERDPEYGEFLNPLWDELAVHTEPVDPGMQAPGSFIFIASPRAVTPFHIDRVKNFHCQIQGTKRIYLWDPMDRKALSEASLERCVAYPYDGFHPPFDDALKERASVWDQKPGLGVHHPWAAPHSVENGPDVSISIGITFRTDASARRAEVLSFNHALRNRGFNPRPEGRYPVVDSLKRTAYRGLRLARRAFGRSN